MEFSERRTEASRFLESLWGGATRTADLVISTIVNNHVHPVRFPSSSLGVVAHEAVQASLVPGTNVYASCCLVDPESAGRHVRGAAEDAVAIAALWLDLDIAGPAHVSERLPPGQGEALEVLRAMEFEPSVVVDSGWGLYGWWIFDRPMALDTEDRRRFFHRLVQGCQATAGAIAGKHGWTVDPTFDLARILRLPGTTNWKVEGDPRPVRVLHESGIRYAGADLARWADLVPKERGPAPPLPEQITAGSRTHSITSLAGTLLNRNVVESASLAAALEHNRLVCDPPLPVDKVRETVAGIYKRYPPGQFRLNGEKKGAPSASAVQFFPMSETEPEAVRFIWEPGIAIGYLTLLAADPGKGKGLICTAITAAMTADRALPGGRPVSGSVLWVSYAESEATAIRPRLDVAGADAQRVYRLLIDRGDGKRASRIFKPEDVDVFEEELANYPDIRMIVLDPVLSFMRSGANINLTSDVRDSLDPLVELADRRNLALLGIAHLNKSELSKILYRVSNSTAFTAIPRSVLAVGDLKDNRRVLAQIKCNYAPLFDPVPFRTIGIAHPTLGTSVGAIEWGEPDGAIDIYSIFEDPRKGEQGKPIKALECAEELKKLLQGGAQWAGITKAKLGLLGFGRPAIEDALTILRVETNGRGRNARWSLPDVPSEKTGGVSPGTYTKTFGEHSPLVETLGDHGESPPSVFVHIEKDTPPPDIEGDA
jgi:hypothetical protein